jgi:deoxyhypusine synthase
LKWRLSDKPITADEPDHLIPMEVRQNTKCKIYFSYTSNMISCGVRETIRFLVQHKLVQRLPLVFLFSSFSTPQVDVIVTTGGGIEEDIIKCLAPTFVGDFKLEGESLRKRGLNRIGNLISTSLTFPVSLPPP